MKKIISINKLIGKVVDKFCGGIIQKKNQKKKKKQ